MEPRPGLRERKKQETRLAIFNAAVALFSEHGFDNVSVAQIAEAANVSKVTVFNYFPAKEDLVFGPMDDQAIDYAGFVRDRAPGESALTAVRQGFLRELAVGGPQLGLDQAGVNFMRIVHGSPHLIARAMLSERRQEQEFAAALTDEVGSAPGDMTPQIVAAVILGVTRAVVAESWRRLLLGEPASDLKADAIAHAERAFDTLADGLAGYAVR